jgi:hypothetical protein
VFEAREEEAEDHRQLALSASNDSGDKGIGRAEHQLLVSLLSTSHPMDWFTALMLLTPNDNKEDLAVENVNGDRRTKLVVSNWTAYSNTKAMLNGAGEQGHIFAGKHNPFKNQDIIQMLGVYILDRLVSSLQLMQKMQPQSKQPTHGNDRIASAIGPGYQQKHRSF